MCKTEAIMLTRKEATHTVHFLNRFIKGMHAVTPESAEIEKMFVFNLMQRFLPHCDFEEGEEKLIISSQEQLERFL